MSFLLITEVYSKTTNYCIYHLGGVHLILPPHIFFGPSKVMAHVTSRVSGSELKIKNKRDLRNLTLTLTLNVLLPSIVFHNKI